MRNGAIIHPLHLELETANHLFLSLASILLGLALRERFSRTIFPLCALDSLVDLPPARSSYVPLGIPLCGH